MRLWAPQARLPRTWEFMSNFDETKHPRGHASNPGAFSGKDNSGPDTGLQDHKRYTEKFDTVALQDYTDAQIAFIATVEAGYDGLGDVEADYSDELASRA